MNITMGIEEELMIIDRSTGEVITDPATEIFERARETARPHQIVNEFLRSQIESNSKICANVQEIETSLRETRQAVIGAAREHGAAVIASSTHPWARWEDQQVTQKTRYQRAEVELQDSVRQFFIGGMHVHAGFATPEIRIRVMNALVTYLPLLLALSTSSPFHAGRLTGLKSYRQNAIAALPRTGLPPEMDSLEAFNAMVYRYQHMGAIKDASELRWDIRPSAHYPTIELRICDICPKVKDAGAIAALYACLIAEAVSEIEQRRAPARANSEILCEGRWRAQRYGSFAFLPDAVTRQGKAVIEVTEALVDRLIPHAQAMNCETQLRHTVTIARAGTSAERQEDVYREAKLDGASEREALRAIVELVRNETEDLFEGP